MLHGALQRLLLEPCARPSPCSTKLNRGASGLPPVLAALHGIPLAAAAAAPPLSSEATPAAARLHRLRRLCPTCPSVYATHRMSEGGEASRPPPPLQAKLRVLRGQHGTEKVFCLPAPQQAAGAAVLVLFVGDQLEARHVPPEVLELQVAILHHAASAAWRRQPDSLSPILNPTPIQVALQGSAALQVLGSQACARKSMRQQVGRGSRLSTGIIDAVGPRQLLSSLLGGARPSLVSEAAVGGPCRSRDGRRH